MIHNRWHPDVPMVAWVRPGDDFIIETYDWTGGFIKKHDSADDVRDIDAFDSCISVRSDSRKGRGAGRSVWWSICSTSARRRKACGA